MFDRYTERARQVIVLAQEESRTLNNNRIERGHLLLGCIKEGGGIAAQILNRLEVDPKPLQDLLRHEAKDVIAPTAPTETAPFTSECKKVLELTLREALGMGQNYIGTEHILLAILREPGEMLSTFLAGEIDDRWEEVIRLEVTEALRGPLPSKDPELSTNEKKELELKDVISDLLSGYRMWKEAKIHSDEWTDVDEALVRWIDGSKVAEFL